MSELLGCPFCGAEGSRIILEIQEPHSHPIATLMPDHTGSATIECRGCNIGLIEDNAEKVIAAWNRRAAKAAVPETNWKQLLQNCYYGWLKGDDIVGPMHAAMIAIETESVPPETAKEDA